ncbi:uncharacterized protein GIQ15_04437 [Arthroderma uncinatum]|uniref:uncharacterized protein n=1 Tax=Arthroderma uncinatum TaxID=74035 RepID=UPI00144ACCBE|nr:uncharacterized protein GIQ15_04437 [Arthroderma uncinatum]KAF3481678.1 hypothetical protein GIQ15_04437 [Arthroderma uncinatum]
MKISALVASLAVAGSAVAAPPAGSKPFGIMSLRSASPIHFGQVSAAHGSIRINQQNQDAVCKVKHGEKPPTTATFYIKDEILYLYTGKGLIQKVFTDRSGFGQGVTGYLTGDGPLPNRFEDKGWMVDGNGNLSFKGQGLLACPTSVPGGGWSIWISGNNPNPGGHTGCLGFSPRTVPLKHPVRCEYSQQ